MGGIRRLSVAVVVNYKRDTDKNGKTSMRALTEQEKTAITDLVKEAMGFNKERGDTLNVVNSPFTGMEVEPVEVVPLWQRPAVLQLAKETGKYLLMAALIAWMYFTQLKPLLRKMQQPATAPLAASAEGLPEMRATGTSTAADEANGPGYRNDLDAVRKIAKEDPKMVANVVKTWVGANE